MPMEEALTARLLAVAQITALVEDRVDWLDRPGAMSALTLTPVSPGREWTHSGPDNLDEPRVQFDCWARTKAEAVALGRAVQAEMEVARDVAGIRFSPAWLEGRNWSREDDEDGGLPVFRVQMDFSFYFEEIAP